MKVVYKFPLLVADLQFIQLPKGAEILSVQVQYGQPVLYAKVDTSSNIYQKRLIRIAGTGHELFGNNLHFIGTIQLEGGHLVFHVFEEKE